MRNNKYALVESIMSKIEPIVRIAVNEHYQGELAYCLNDVVDIFNEMYAKKKLTIDKYIQFVKDEHEYDDLDVRLAWDFARHCKYYEWNFLPKDEQGYLLSTDAKLTTLFVKALKASNIEYEEEK